MPDSGPRGAGGNAASPVGHAAAAGRQGASVVSLPGNHCSVVMGTLIKDTPVTASPPADD